MTSTEDNAVIRHWESADFSISKAVLVEGHVDVGANQPRFGSKGTIILEKNWSVGGEISEAHLTKQEILSEMLLWIQKDENSVVNFRIGYASNDVDRTLEEAIKSMYLTEKSQLTIRVKLSPKKNNLAFLDNEEDFWVTFSCVVTLATLENVEPIFKWTPAQKLETSRKLKEQGVHCFILKRYLDAFWAFRQSLTLACFVVEENRKQNDATLLDNSLLEEAEDLKTKCSTNLAGVHLQLENYRQVISLATELLSTETSCKDVKLLYRRGVSHLELKNYESAIRDLAEAQELEPNNKAVFNSLTQARTRHKAENNKLSQGLKKMFS